MNKLAETLKQRRKAKGLTLQRLGELSGVHTSHLGRIEREERFPSARILKKLAEPLGFGEIELLKLASYLSLDNSDSSLGELRRRLTLDINAAFFQLLDKLNDSFGNAGKLP